MNDLGLVIGGGPSLKKFGQLKQLKKSGFKGKLFVCDKVLVYCLKNGITPKKFPEYYIISGETYDNVSRMFDDEIVKKYADGMKFVYVSDDESLYHIWEEFNFDCYQIQRDDIISFLSNAGCIAWYLAWHEYKCKTVYLLGMDLGFYPDDVPYNIGPNTEMGKEFYTIIDGMVCPPRFRVYKEGFKWIRKKVEDKVKTIDLTKEPIELLCDC